MGKDFLDGKAIEHGIGGFISHFVILFDSSRPSRARWFTKKQVLGFLVANGIHIGMELVERNHNQFGDEIETDINHAGDIIAFAVGWLFAWSLHGQPSQKLRIVLATYLLFAFLGESFREVFPRQQILSRGVFKIASENPSNREREEVAEYTKAVPPRMAVGLALIVGCAYAWKNNNSQ